jgi:cytochrome oxidase Cu insertion factor (SCO1/SenC/PrrC family)
MKPERHAQHPHSTWVKHHRKRNIIVIMIVAGALSMAVMVAASLSATGVKVGQKAPDFTAQDINNNYFQLYGHQGTPVLIEFMRTTCSHCVNEAPVLASFWSNHQNQMVLVSVSTDPAGDTPSVLMAFSTTYHQPWAFIRDTTQLTGTYGVSGTPTIFLLDKNSVVRYSFQGETSLQTLESSLQTIL